MPQSLVRIIGHLVFSTKRRVPLIDTQIRPHLYGYMAGVLERDGCQEILIGGTEDHIHAVMVLAKGLAPIKLVENVKKRSSAWIKEQGSQYQEFYWQSGYALFSVSPSNLRRVREYVERQEAHHQTMTFQDELRALLRKHGMEFDEPYLWD